MECFNKENSSESSNLEIETPEQLSALLKGIIDTAFEASNFIENSQERKKYEIQTSEMIKKVKDYYEKNFHDYSIREREMFVQFISLPASTSSYFVLRGIELLGAIEYRLKPSKIGLVDHREFYKRMLPYLVDLIDGFLGDDDPQLAKFIEIGEFTSAIIASDFYEMGKTYYEAHVFEIHQAFREIIKIMVEYKEVLSIRAVPVMTQHRRFLNFILNKLNKSEGESRFNA